MTGFDAIAAQLDDLIQAARELFLETAPQTKEEEAALEFWCNLTLASRKLTCLYSASLHTGDPEYSEK
jgi:hypothetical protein